MKGPDRLVSCYPTEMLINIRPFFFFLFFFFESKGTKFLIDVTKERRSAFKHSELPVWVLEGKYFCQSMFNKSWFAYFLFFSYFQQNCSSNLDKDIQWQNCLNPFLVFTVCFDATVLFSFSFSSFPFFSSYWVSSSVLTVHSGLDMDLN